jgi:formate hydrogenlyase transcriptional activator
VVLADLSRLSSEDRYRLLLSVSQAANESLELATVLEAVARALEGFVDIDGIGVSEVSEGQVITHALYAKGAPRPETDSFADLVAHPLARSAAELNLPSVVEPMPLAGSAVEHVGATRRPYVCQELAKELRFAGDARLLEFGVRSFVCVPLVVRDRFIGSLVFGCTVPGAFGEREADLLMTVSGPVAAAVANALAFAEIARLTNRLQKEKLLLREELEERNFQDEIVGGSRSLRRLLAQVNKVAATDATVLISGETGTGKELVARALHRHSHRADHALVVVNCAALPANLIASELFGHEKGAFTGAVARRLGRFELANGGTLFLDEAGDLPPEVQVALLRVLQEGELQRVGGSQTLAVDVRVIAATNRDLAADVAAGRFRSDLYYRLAVFPIQVPALRERAEDIPVLVEYFAARLGPRLGKRFRAVERESMERLQAYRWPGNVRELQNVVERAAILSEGDTLRVDPSLLPGAAGGRAPVTRDVAALPLAEALLRHERHQIEEALAASGGKVSGPRGAAVRLGVPATTLESKIRRLGIDKRRPRNHESS